MGLIKTLLGKALSQANKMRSAQAGTPDVLEVLAAQHQDVDALIQKLEKGDGDRGSLFQRLADNLAAHAAVEEQIFYPAVMTKDTESMLEEAAEEHLAIKRLLADMLHLSAGSDEFMAKLAVLKEQVTHHAHEEEEAELFPKVMRMLDIDQRRGVASEVLALFEELMQGHPATQVPSETGEAAEIRRR